MTKDLEDSRETAGIERLDPLRGKVLSSVRRLRQTKLTMLQAEIIDQLIDGRRTATELVLGIFQTRPGDEGFQAYYARMRRDLRELERRGYVSTNLFGRDKPYRLTRNGIAMLSSILPDMGKPRLLEGLDLGVFIAAAAGGIVLWLVRQSTEPTYSVVLAVFFTLLGVSLCKFAYILRKVV